VALEVAGGIAGLPVVDQPVRDPLLGHIQDHGERWRVPLRDRPALSVRRAAVGPSELKTGGRDDRIIYKGG